MNLYASNTGISVYSKRRNSTV